MGRNKKTEIVRVDFEFADFLLEKVPEGMSLREYTRMVALSEKRGQEFFLVRKKKNGGLKLIDEFRFD